eukprot:TRINITY_DN17058_c1_g1_i1.p1 TRINITY_DN17058_c1_g1~~TRINITY_DN17058_c1_g1_i1.p1  ORF type:complete len:257 (+),score=38.51 TRINITY_DN17058_c1_g1_i1:61-831(+)
MEDDGAIAVPELANRELPPVTDSVIDQDKSVTGLDHLFGYTGAELNCLSNKPSGPKFSFGGSKSRSQSTNASRGHDVPGPGSYLGPVVDSDSRYKRQSKYSFGASPRLGEKAVKLAGGPGPGAYSPPCTVGDARQVAFTGRPKEAARIPFRHKSPGPGAHTLPSMLSSTGTSISKTPRIAEEAVKFRPPGPGEYNEETGRAQIQRRPPGWGFGSARQRPRTHIGQPGPGPGAYSHKNELPHDPAALAHTKKYQEYH